MNNSEVDYQHHREVCYCLGPIYAISKTAFALLDIQRCKRKYG